MSIVLMSVAAIKVKLLIKWAETFWAERAEIFGGNHSSNINRGNISLLRWCHDSQHNGSQHNDTQRNSKKHDDLHIDINC